MVIKRRTLRRKSFRKKTIVRRALRKASDKRIAKIAQSVVSRNAENKSQRSVTNRNLHSILNSTSAFRDENIWTWSDEIGPKAQGAGQGQRIGNKIKLKRLIYKQRFWVNTATPDLHLYHLKVFVLGDKSNPNQFSRQGVVDAMASGPFFNFGSQSTGVTELMPDMVLPVDTDRWRVHKTREFKLGVSSSPQGTVSGFGNNDYKFSASLRLNLAKYLPKYVQFRDTQTGIFSRNICVVCLVVRADNQTHSPESNTGGIISSVRNIEYEYEDL